MSRVHLDGVMQRLISDERLGFPLARRVAILPELVRLAELEGANDDDVRKFGLQENTIDALLAHLRCAVEAFEAEQENPAPRLTVVKTKARRERKGTR